MGFSKQDRFAIDSALQALEKLKVLGCHFFSDSFEVNNKLADAACRLARQALLLCSGLDMKRQHAITKLYVLSERRRVSLFRQMGKMLAMTDALSAMFYHQMAADAMMAVLNAQPQLPIDQTFLNPLREEFVLHLHCYVDALHVIGAGSAADESRYDCISRARQVLAFMHHNQLSECTVDAHEIYVRQYSDNCQLLSYFVDAKASERLLSEARSYARLKKRLKQPFVVAQAGLQSASAEEGVADESKADPSFLVVRVEDINQDAESTATTMPRLDSPAGGSLSASSMDGSGLASCAAIEMGAADDLRLKRSFEHRRECLIVLLSSVVKNGSTRCFYQELSDCLDDFEMRLGFAERKQVLRRMKRLEAEVRRWHAGFESSKEEQVAVSLNASTSSTVAQMKSGRSYEKDDVVSRVAESVSRACTEAASGQARQRSREKEQPASQVAKLVSRSHARVVLCQTVKPRVCLFKMPELPPLNILPRLSALCLSCHRLWRRGMTRKRRERLLQLFFMFVVVPVCLVIQYEALRYQGQMRALIFHRA